MEKLLKLQQLQSTRYQQNQEESREEENFQKSKIEFSSEDISGKNKKKNSSSRRMRSFSGQKKKFHRKGFVFWK